MREKARLEKDVDRRKWFIAAKEDKRRRDEMEQSADDSLMELAAATILADPVQLEAFQFKLDTYDEATVRALLENEKLLDIAQARIDDMLERAYVIEDGRRVFKTRDGLKVYDEHGTELSEEIVHPDQIGPERPYWEDYQATREQERALIEEREEILQFQDKLDHARERAGDESLTQQELDDLEADLEKSMPEAVARQMPGYEHSPQPELKKAFGSASISAPAQAAQPAPGFTPI